VARIVVAQHCTFFINSLCHTIGRQPYSSTHSARDSAVMAFFTFGEGYHNYHHEFQHDYRNGVKPWQWDPSKWTIWMLSKLGLAWDLRRVPDSRIVLAEMREARKRAQHQLDALQGKLAVPAKDASLALDALLDRLSGNYHELEKAVNDRVEVSRQKLREWHKQTREAMRELSVVLRDLSAHGLVAPQPGIH
jgi:stearoyl-CoA desaturase (delta-9 desaturase)